MTPARKAALQWFHDRGEAKLQKGQSGQPSGEMIMAMQRDGQLEYRQPGNPVYFLTDKGRRALRAEMPE